ncbi:MAG: MerR family transcriptional regulator [Bacteroidales bacterium]|jgi:DNA-binding transcriptional MerR regulator|nr:MerR family transcriptional regulator [Bacteroidales bacterium]
MQEGSNKFSIRDLENFSGIKAHTIRIWEKRYGILEPDRTDSNIRTYNEFELKKILNVSYLNRNGFKISKIAGMDDEHLASEVMDVSNNQVYTDHDFNPGNVLLSAMRFSEAQFREAIDKYIKNYPVEDAYCRYLYPLLEKARILWQTGSLSRAQEQFVRNTIREIIISRDSSITGNNAGEAPVVAMVNTLENCSDNNFLFYKYTLKKRGFDLIFSGGILPDSEVLEIYNIKPFDFLVLNSSSFDFARKKLSYFSNIGKALLLKKIILADFPDEKVRRVPENIAIAHNPREFLNILSSLTKKTVTKGKIKN